MAAKEFDVKDFVSQFSQNPDIGLVDQLKKVELVQVAKHYGVVIKTAMRKSEVRSALVQYLVDEELLPESCLDTIPETGISELRKLELEYELKVKQLEIQKERELRELEIQAQIEREDKERQAQIEREREERQAQIEREDKERQAQREREERKAQIEREIRLRELELEASKQAPLLHL